MSMNVSKISATKFGKSLETIVVENLPIAKKASLGKRLVRGLKGLIFGKSQPVAPVPAAEPGGISQAAAKIAKLTKEKGLIADLFFRQEGRILRMQEAKRAAQRPVMTSIPTQQAIDEMIGVERIDALRDAGSFFNIRRCANTLAAFKAQGKPSVVKSVPTQQAIDELNRVAVVDELKAFEAVDQADPKAWIKGPKSILRKRLDVYEAVYGSEGIPLFQEMTNGLRKMLDNGGVMPK